MSRRQPASFYTGPGAATVIARDHAEGDRGVTLAAATRWGGGLRPACQWAWPGFVFGVGSQCDGPTVLAASEQAFAKAVAERILSLTRLAFRCSKRLSTRVGIDRISRSRDYSWR